MDCGVWCEGFAPQAEENSELGEIEVFEVGEQDAPRETFSSGPLHPKKKHLSSVNGSHNRFVLLLHLPPHLHPPLLVLLFILVLFLLQLMDCGPNLRAVVRRLRTTG